jgi:hypothetical protein
VSGGKEDGDGALPNEHGVIVNVAGRVTPSAHAVTVTLVGDATCDVVTVKFAEDAPAGTRTLPVGGRCPAALSIERLTR